MKKQNQLLIWAKRILVFCFAIIIIVVGSFCFLQYRSLAPIKGKLAIDGLRSPVEVIRDQWGVPHIKGKNTDDTMIALGYVMASERWFQMEIHRRVARGELAEIIGKKALPVDKLYRTLNFVEHFNKVIAKHPHSEQMKREAEAFYHGVNAYIQNNPRPIEFYLLNIPVREFTLEDAYAFIGYMSYSFGIGLRQDSFLSTLKDNATNDLFEDLRSEPSSLLQKITSNFPVEIKGVEYVHQFLLNGFAPFEGSNGWLIGKSKTLNKRAILANDPHISYSKPNLWMEIHMVVDSENPLEQKEDYGFYLPLIPFPVLYHSHQKAWGLTMSLTDDMDVYRIKRMSDSTYELDGKEEKFLESEVEIKVKGENPYIFTRRVSFFGPLLNEVYDLEKKPELRDLALHWSLYRPHNDPIRSFYQMRVAKTMNEFKAAVATGVAPGLNVLYADNEDNIAWWMFGEVLQKPHGLKSDRIIEGSKTSDVASVAYPFSSLPFSENPESGFIVSANHRPLNFFSNQRGDFQPDDRYKTILALLEKKSDWTVEATEELQHLPVNLKSQATLKYLLTFLSEQEKNQLSNDFLTELESWSGLSEHELRAPMIYYAWLRSLSMMSLDKLNPEEKNTYSQFPAEWFRLERLLKKLNPETHDHQQLVQKSFIDALNYLKKEIGSDQNKWQWGRLHTLELVHPLGMVKPLNFIFNSGPHSIDGAYMEINNMKWGQFDEGFKVKAGPSVRRIIDFHQVEKARAVLPLGISGNDFSPYSKDQLPLFLKGDFRQMNLGKEIFENTEANEAVQKLQLIPSSYR